MKKSFEKFAGTLRQMPKRRMASAAIFALYTIFLCSCSTKEQDGNEPEIRDLEQNQVQIIYTHPCFSGKKLSAVISDMKLTESNLIFIKRLLILDLFPRDDIRIEKMIFPLGEQIGTDGPCTVPEDGKQSDIVGKPLEQGFRELEKSIYKTFLLSVVLIFIMRLFSK